MAGGRPSKMLAIFTFCFILSASFADKGSTYNKTFMDTITNSGKGDIMIPDSFRNAIKNEDNLWKNGVVPYILTGYSATDKERIEFGLQWLQYMVNKASPKCLKVKKRTNEDLYLNIRQAGGCRSHVGMNPASKGGQNLSLDSPGCLDKNTVMHELIHALGFRHEQDRPDRDKYITILWDNINKTDHHVFDKIDSQYVTTQGMPYNYLSLMHYADDGFSKNGKPTMVSKPPGKKLGSGKLQPMDVKRIRMLYRCKPFESKNDDYAMMKTEDGVQIGGDYKKVTPVENEGLCKEKCMSNRKCLAVSYNKKRRTCLMHRKLTRTDPNSDYNFYKKINKAKCRTVKRLNTQQAGHDLASGPGRDADFCGRMCSSEEECTGVTFNLSNKTCYYHKKSVPTVANTNTVYMHKSC